MLNYNKTAIYSPEPSKKDKITSRKVEKKFDYLNILLFGLLILAVILYFAG